MEGSYGGGMRLEARRLMVMGGGENRCAAVDGEEARWRMGRRREAMRSAG